MLGSHQEQIATPEFDARTSAPKHPHTFLDVLYARNDVDVEALQEACLLDLREHLKVR